MAQVVIKEQHRDFLADLVDHTPLLGQEFGPTNKHTPEGPSLLLLYALLDDLAQSAWTYWGWHIDGYDSEWRAGVVTESALYCQHLLCTRHSDHEWAASLLVRQNDFRQALQDWYKRIDYMPEARVYEVGACGEEFPAPPDLIYLIWVVLEASEHNILRGESLFPPDSEERTECNQWRETFSLMRDKLLSKIVLAQTGSPPPGRKPFSMQDAFKKVIQSNTSSSVEEDLSDLDLNLIALSCGGYARWSKVRAWVEDSQPELGDLFNEVVDTAVVEDIIDTVVMLNARYEASRQEDDSDSWMTPGLKELFGYLELHELDSEELNILGQYIQEMQSIQNTKQ